MKICAAFVWVITNGYGAYKRRVPYGYAGI